MNRKFFNLAIIPTLFLFLVSCTPASRPSAHVEDPSVFVDPALQGTIAVLGVNQSVNRGGFPEVQVEVLNQSPNSKDIRYRTEWFDQSGMRIDSILSRWQTRRLRGNAPILIHSVAPRPGASSWQVQVADTRSTYADPNPGAQQ